MAKMPAFMMNKFKAAKSGEKMDGKKAAPKAGAKKMVMAKAMGGGMMKQSAYKKGGKVK